MRIEIPLQMCCSCGYFKCHDGECVLKLIIHISQFPDVKFQLVALLTVFVEVWRIYSKNHAENFSKILI